MGTPAWRMRVSAVMRIFTSAARWPRPSRSVMWLSAESPVTTSPEWYRAGRVSPPPLGPRKAIADTTAPARTISPPTSHAVLVRRVIGKEKEEGVGSRRPPLRFERSGLTYLVVPLAAAGDGAGEAVVFVPVVDFAELPPL